MKITTTLSLFLAISIGATAQTTIPNGDFEAWGGNPSPGVVAEPTGWYSNKSGSTIAKLGPQTCFQNTPGHTGSYSVKMQTENYLGTKVNGVVTTGVVNAPSTDKSLGYIGTINTSSASDNRRTAFVGRPDSLVGWYQYTPGAGSEQGKIRAVLHIGDYNDPETPVSGNHPDLSANKIGDALFLTTVGATVSSWTRFSVPFSYVSASAPAYILLNITSSADQMTTVGGSILLLDDLQVVYNPVTTGLNSTPSLFGITAFPNPVNDDLTLNINGVENVAGHVQLMDVSGRVIKTVSAGVNTLHISLAGISAGLYFIRYYDEAHAQTIKITKQ